MKAAITGATGFLGQAVIRQLKANKISHTVFDRKKHNLLKPRSLKDLVAGRDVIIHLAAVNRGDDLDIVRVNILGTLSLLKAAAKYAPQAKIIFSSTFQIYLKESLYGLSKKFAEDLLLQYTQKAGLKGIILRISNIYGPGGKPFYNSVIATFAHLIKTGEILKINGDGEQKRDFVYVDDVAKAIIKTVLHKQKASLETMNICSGKEISLNDVLETIRGVYRKKFEVMYNKEVKEKPWPTKGKNFAEAQKLLGWRPTTPLLVGLGNVMKA